MQRKDSLQSPASENSGNGSFAVPDHHHDEPDEHFPLTALLLELAERNRLE